MPIPVILAALANAGLSLLGNAVLAKGKEVIEEKIGVKIPDDPSGLTSEKKLELMQAQSAHEEFLVNAALEETKAFLQDRQSARQRDVELAKQGMKNLRGDVLAYGAIGALVLSTLLLLLGVSIPETNEKLLYLVIGALIVIVKDVYGFEFGSSKEGAKAAQAMTESLKNGK